MYKYSIRGQLVGVSDDLDYLTEQLLKYGGVISEWT